MSKKAQEIAAKHADTTNAAEVAENTAVSKDQVWSGEGYTIYVFDDNSMLAQCGPSQIAVDADDEASVEAYVAWLGDDAEHDAERIANMREAFEA